LSHKQGGLIHEFGVWLGHDLKIRLLYYYYVCSLGVRIYLTLSLSSVSQVILSLAYFVNS